MWSCVLTASYRRDKFTQPRGHFFYQSCTVCGDRMAHRKWKETKQQTSMLPGPAVPGCCLVSFHFLWAILCPQAVLVMQKPLNIWSFLLKINLLTPSCCWHVRQLSPWVRWCFVHKSLLGCNSIMATKFSYIACAPGQKYLILIFQRYQAVLIDFLEGCSINLVN